MTPQHNPCDDKTKQPSSALPLAQRICLRFARVLVLPIFTALVLACFALLLTSAPPAQAQARRPNLVLLKIGPLSAVIGQQVVYTLTLANIGTAAANDITITDQTPAGLTFVGFGGACSGATCNISSMGVLASPKIILVTFTIPSDYDLFTNPIITNTATVTSSTRESSYANNTAYWGTLPLSVADLVLTKTASSDIVAAGERVTYTLTIENLGPSQALSVTLGELLTPTLPFITGTTGACNFLYTGTLALCGHLPVNATQVITAVYEVPSDFVTPMVKNGALVGSLSFDPHPFSNVATRTITITQRADMSITKEGPAQVVPGTDAVFTLTVENLGPSDATAVAVDDPGFGGLTPAVGAPCAGGFPCDLGLMKPQSVTQIMMTFTVPSSLTGTEVVNIAGVTSTITDPVEINNTSTVTAPVVRISSLDVVKEGPASAVPGNLITYTVTVTNNGPSDAAEVTLTDHDPISLTAQGSPCVLGVCSLPDLPAGGSTTLTLTYSIDPFARGTVTNTAGVTSTGTPTPVTDTVLTELTPQADLAIYKTDGLNSATFGTMVTYMIVVTNSGPSGVDGAVIADALPPMLGGASWSCAATLPNTCSPASGVGDINILARIAPNSVVAVTASGMLATSHPSTTMVNTATVAAPADVTETDLSNNSSTDQTNLNYVTDLSIVKTAAPSDTVAPGELLTYTLVVGNAGPSKAISATVHDMLSWMLVNPQWVCMADIDAVCGVAAGAGSLLNLPVSVEPGSFVTFTITGTLDLEARNEIYNQASVSATQSAGDPNGNNQSAVSVPIQSKAFIAIDKSDGQAIAVPSVPLTYVITLANKGPSNANGLVFDLFPSELSNAQWMSNSLNGAQVISNLAGITTAPGVQVDLPVGSVLTLTVSAQVNLTATGWLTNIAQFDIGKESPGLSVGPCATSCGFAPQNGQLPAVEPKPIINTNPITQAIDVDQIAPPGALAITKRAQTSGDGNVLGADRVITFTLLVTNTGGGPLHGVTVTDALESYLQYVDGSATPAPASTTPLTWHLGDLGSGTGASIQFVVKVSAEFGGTVLNTASTASNLTQSVLSNEVLVQTSPTAITLLSFTAQHDAGGVNVVWVTGSERNAYGFNIYRSETGNRADAVQVNMVLIPAGAFGGQYVFFDAGALADKTYTYWLQEIEISGTARDYLETATVQPAGRLGMGWHAVFIPVIMR